MDEQQRTARAIEGRAAQKLTINEANDLLEREGRTGRDLQDGLEVANRVDIEAGISAEMEEIDPGWNDFQQRQYDEATAGWNAAAAAEGEAELVKAGKAYEMTADDPELLAAAMYVARTRSTERRDCEARESPRRGRVG